MTVHKALALAVLTFLSTASPVIAAKEAKVPRCNGQAKRPANSYGTVLPTLPSRTAGSETATTNPTQLFPSNAPAATAPAARDESSVPPISAVTPSLHHDGVPQPVYESC